MTRVLMIAAPTSGAGKTVLTLALLRALRDRGVDVRAAKSGPDYIDPQFHEAASGAPSVNLDAWAMTPGAVRALGNRAGGELLIVEAAMGLLDGAPDGSGSAADLAATLGAPVVMVIDAAKQAHSAALPLAGARALRADLTIAGALLNRTGSPRHARIAAGAIERAGFRAFGAVPRDARLAQPSRHLGLVPARERADLEAFIAGAAEIVAEAIDLDALIEAAAPLETGGEAAPLAPFGQRIAVARDDAFAFAYPHLLDGWRDAGAEITTFSPLADEGPDADADAVFLPGGYPELHAGRLAAARSFKKKMREASQNAIIYGECGGYMALGEVLFDAGDEGHEMLGLLSLVTSFAERRLTLGYRRLTPRAGFFAPSFDGPLTAHEFHYATILMERRTGRLFDASDAEGVDLGPIGLQAGRVAGSFAHVIAPDRRTR